VYDMYPWAPAVPGGRPPGTPRAQGDSPSPRTPVARPRQAGLAQATRAVQVALDRRDNGGDAAGAAGQPTAGPTRQ
jgi:hypothetical protein